MAFEVISKGDETIIQNEGLKIRVFAGKNDRNKAFCLGHLYKVEGGFVPVTTYVFEVLEDRSVNVEVVKQAMDSFFRDHLNTLWYVKEVPRSSLLFLQEAERLYGKVVSEGQNGTVSVI